MELKASVLKRMMAPQGRSVAELSRETGITETTLYTWRNRGGPISLNTGSGFISRSPSGLKSLFLPCGCGLRATRVCRA